MTHALPSASTLTRFVVSPSASVGRSSVSTSATTSASGGSSDERFGHSREPGTREEARPGERDLDGLAPRRAVRREILAGDDAAALVAERQQSLRDRARVDAVRALVAQQLERTHEPGLLEELPVAQERASRRVDARACVERQHRLEHLEAADVCRRHRHAVPREAQRGLDEALPRQPTVRAPQLRHSGRDPRHAAGRSADRVVDELLAERHVELHHRRADSGRNGDEAVEVPRLLRAGVPVDRVAAAQKTRHDGLGDAGREARRNGGVRGAAAVLQDLDSRLAGRGMARRYAGFHPPLPYSATAASVVRAASARRTGTAETTTRRLQWLWPRKRSRN